METYCCANTSFMLILKADPSFTTSAVELVQFSLESDDFGRERRYALRLDEVSGDSARLHGEGVDTTITRQFQDDDERWTILRIANATFDGGYVMLRNQGFAYVSEPDLAAELDERRFDALVRRYHAEGRTFEPAMTQRLQQRRLSEIRYILGKLADALTTLGERWQRHAVVPPLLAAVWEPSVFDPSDGEERALWLREAVIVARAGDDVVYYQTNSESFECGRITDEKITWPTGSVDTLLDKTTTATGDLPTIRLVLDRAWSPGNYPD